MKRRLMALALLPALLIPSAGVSAVTPADPECMLIGAVLLDDPACVAIYPLRNAQRIWDLLAARVGPGLVTRFLGPRPKTLADLEPDRPILLPPLE
jgi:hypothetical protein